jgi:hypothetical protein
MKSTSKPMPPQQLNHRADALNPNRGTSGQSPANAHLNGNRGGQLNPNNRGTNSSNGKASGRR